jgi:hypothetical protein
MFEFSQSIDDRRVCAAEMRHSMKFRTIATVAVATFGVLIGSGSRELAAQRAAAGAAASAWVAPRAADGRADLQGVWSFQNLTPLERPAEYASKPVLKDEELDAFVKLVVERNNKDSREGAGTDVDVSRAYNDFWWDFGTRASHRTSLITDPPDGRRPALTPDVQTKAAAAAARMQRPAEGPEDRSLAERCIVGFNAGPPVLPSAYNNNLEIIQNRDYVVIHTEMIHDARIVPLDGRPHVPATVRLRHGDSRGRWDGDTLIVDTTNFVDTTDTTLIGAQRAPSDRMHLIERFRRVAPDALEYEFTIDDPKTYVRPWTAMVPMLKLSETMYEYACHEGNYGLAGILGGARAQEKKTSAPSGTGPGPR